MKTVNRETAVREIADTLLAARDDGLPSPYFFIVGAGVSAPEVQLAGAIEEECRQRAMARDPSATGPVPGLSAMDGYSYWFRQAFPNRAQRQRYLRKKMEHARVSDATFRLAHLLAAPEPIAGLVVTPNFDDLLTRVLILFGKRPIVCDHPATTPRIDPDSHDLQVVHVHGTHWFYDCANLDYEIDERAERGGDQPEMSELLGKILDKRSPIVVGYSGWKDDVIMTALHRRLVATPLGHNLYWFCYRAADAETLPPWLVNDEEVFLVMPEEVAPETTPTVVAPPREAIAASAGGAPASPSSQVTTATTVTTQTWTPGADKGPGAGVLTATRVFESLIRALNLPPPRLTDDPLGFFVEQLQTNLPATRGAEDDLYRLSTVMVRVQAAHKRELQGVPGGGDPLDAVRDALRRLHYRDVIRLARDLGQVGLSPGAKRELVDALWSSAVGLLDDSVEELDGYRLIVEVGDALREQDAEAWLGVRPRIAKSLVFMGITLANRQELEKSRDAYEDMVVRFGDADEPEIQADVATALCNQGVLLDALGDTDKALAAYESVLSRFGAATDPGVRKQVAKALVNKGYILGALAQTDQELAAYDVAVQRFDADTDPEVLALVAIALFNKGYRLGTLGQYDEEMAAYDGVVSRFRDASDPELRRQVAMALNNKGVRLGGVGRTTEEVAVYDEIVTRFGAASEPGIREQVAKALFNKAYSLGVLGRSDEELAAYDDIVTRFGTAPEPALRVQVAMALCNKGVRLGTEGRFDEEVAAYDSVVSRFGDAPETEVRTQVAIALFNKGYRLGMQGRFDDENATYDSVVSRFGGATEPELRIQVAMSLFNKGYRLGEMGKTEPEVAVYDDLVARFGDASEPALRVQVAMALCNKGFRLHTQGRQVDAIAVYDDVVRRNGGATEPELRVQVAIALNNKADSLRALGRNDEAMAAYDDVLARAQGDDDVGLRAQVDRATTGRAELTGS